MKRGQCFNEGKLRMFEHQLFSAIARREREDLALEERATRMRWAHSPKNAQPISMRLGVLDNSKSRDHEKAEFKVSEFILDRVRLARDQRSSPASSASGDAPAVSPRRSPQSSDSEDAAKPRRRHKPQPAASPLQVLLQDTGQAAGPRRAELPGEEDDFMYV